ncbi:hypothetical protein SLS53_005077 [Cytospora paraplurivora]|uniref:CipC-like antibiotic response protein n=1 Tax=Cytospora paraplurivora TaxID=2898453 RepID=A0AAN9UEZ6_9PEZI
MVFGFGESKEARDQVYDGQPHEGHTSHELIGSAAGFEAVRLWEKKQREEGKPVEHSTAKELIAAAAGFEVDKLIETKGLDFVDREKAKHQAKRQAEELYNQQYGEREQFHPDHEGPREFQGY